MAAAIRWHRFGSRAGYVSCALGLLSLGAVLCFRFPSQLTTPELRAVYPVEWLRLVLRAGLGAALALGAAGLLLAHRRRYAALGFGLAALAVALGGSRVPVERPVPPARHLGLDWLVLDFFVVALVFVPFERSFRRIRDQKVFREGWRTDLLHYATSHLLIGVTTLAITAPALLLSRRLDLDSLAARVATQPAWLQFAAAVLVADLTQYWVHRAFHAVPLLWRFHAIHHSSRVMDWLAGSRLHLVDIVVTRGAAFIPLALAGFSDRVLEAYLVFVAAQAVFIHSNTRFELRGVGWLLATPAFHHWHHSAEPEAIDKNFAVNLSLLDALFGTRHVPRGRWPERYGLATERVPDGWLGQVLHPFRDGDA